MSNELYSREKNCSLCDIRLDKLNKRGIRKVVSTIIGKIKYCKKRSIKNEK